MEQQCLPGNSVGVVGQPANEGRITKPMSCFISGDNPALNQVSNRL
jgi:hypothetical protein